MGNDQGGDVHDARQRHGHDDPARRDTGDRDRLVRLIRERVLRSGVGDGLVHGEAVSGSAADDELRALLRTADFRTDLEARHVTGWLCAARAAADCSGLGAVHGRMAGTLLFPVWVAEPSLVPEPLAANWTWTGGGAARGGPGAPGQLSAYAEPVGLPGARRPVRSPPRERRPALRTRRP